VPWREAHRERMEAFEFFAGGGGGFGIFNVPDEATLNRIMVEYPLTPYSELTVRPILDGDTALGQWREIMREMMDAAGPAV
jgi:muconolactone delta-isomerase